jgi:hypothetical protein
MRLSLKRGLEWVAIYQSETESKLLRNHRLEMVRNHSYFMLLLLEESSHPTGMMSSGLDNVHGKYIF